MQRRRQQVAVELVVNSADSLQEQQKEANCRMRPTNGCVRLLATAVKPTKANTTNISLCQWETQIFQLLRRAARNFDRKPAVQLRVAGGWVRDKLLNRNTGDIDIAIQYSTGTNFANHLQQYVETYAHSNTNPSPPLEYMPSNCHVKCIEAKPTNSRHLETAAVCIDDRNLDFVQLRTEEYALEESSRVPCAIKEGTPEEDAHRRDFTVNSLFYNLHTRQIEDCTGKGLSDLHKQVLRTPLPPTITIREDPLRALRAVRFACKLGFTICFALRQALCDPDVHTLIMGKVSRERVGIEIAQVIQCDRVVHGLRLVEDYDLIRSVFGPAFGYDSRDVKSEYHTSIQRIQDALKVCGKILPVVDRDEQKLFEQQGREVLIYAMLTENVSSIEPIMQDALRRPKGTQRDVRTTLMLSAELEELLRKKGASMGEEMEVMDEEAWIDVAEILRRGGEHLWVAVLAACATRMGMWELPLNFIRQGLTSRVCRVEPAVNGHTLQKELALTAGPQVGKAIRQLIRLQLQHQRHTWQSHKQSESHLSSDACIEMLKKQWYDHM